MEGGGRGCHAAAPNPVAAASARTEVLTEPAEGPATKNASGRLFFAEREGREPVQREK